MLQMLWLLSMAVIHSLFSCPPILNYWRYGPTGNFTLSVVI